MTVRWEVLKALVEHGDWMRPAEVQQAIYHSNCSPTLGVLLRQGEIESRPSISRVGAREYRALQP